MNSNLRICMAQLNFLVGDISGNREKMVNAAKKARDEHKADLIVFPELALSGYPPEDLLLRNDFHEAIRSNLKKLCQEIQGIAAVVGYPDREKEKIFNAAAFIENGEIIANYHKQCLPNYGVFDEKRYFKSGKAATVVEFKGVPLGLCICEDLWFPEPCQQSKKAGAKLFICINSSPFDIFKLEEREKIIKARIHDTQIPVLYTHCIGGQDEVVFDGRSMVIDDTGKLCILGPLFEEALINVDFSYHQNKVQVLTESVIPYFPREAKAYKALVTGVHDYVQKNNFSGALIGLSGGIDSALTLCIAVDALGKDNVEAILMPSRYTAEISNFDALELANNLGVKYRIISIEKTFQAFLDSLHDDFKGCEPDTTEQNIQSRCRAIILMALSNKFGKLVLTTGNKSELATGYCTLYGDMAGSFSVLKDVYKTLVYQLAEYRNSISPVIPKRIIERQPSAELAENQLDVDLLPPYPVLDQILMRFIEEDQSATEIAAQGFDEEIVHRVIKWVMRNEYKRRQAPPGVKITTKAFGRDRRYPITSGFKY